MTRIALALWLGLSVVAGGARANDELHAISVGGVERSYVLHLPPTATAGVSLPLVVVLHGAGGNARGTAAQTGFSEEADWRGFAAAYPSGSHGPGGEVFALGRPKFLVWNGGLCCGWASEHGIDDVAFVRALVAEIASAVPIDRRRVYATGISNGGMMAYRLACEASDVFAAVGVVSGALVTARCTPSEPVSVIHIHGTDDTYVPLAGGPGALMPPGYAYPSAESAIAFWRAADGCDSSPRESKSLPGVRLVRGAGCRAGTGIDFYVLDGGKHSWPGGDRVSVILPPVSQAIAATAVLWEFFAAHPKLSPLG